MYIDFLTYQYVYNPANLPGDWPAYTKEVINEADPIDENWQRLEVSLFDAYMSDANRVATYEAALQYYNNSKQLKVTEYVDDRFIDLPPSKIDFRRHLKDGYVLNKTILMAENGRPVHALYKYENIEVAKIKFEFETSGFNLVTRRTEKLCYFDLNGNESQDYIISDETWDLSQTYYLVKAINERYAARCKIFDEIKAYINAIMLSTYLGQGLTYENVLADGYNFWKEYSSDIDAWLHIGASGPFVDRITNDSVFAFLNFEISPNISIRDWIITRVTY